MKVQQNARGQFDVLNNGGEVVATLSTNAEAWAWLDRNEVHPLCFTRSFADRMDAYDAPAQNSPNPPQGEPQEVVND